MPPAANESQGLKIAVAAFVSLTVILAVTTYFMYSNYSQTSSQLTKAREDLSTEQKAKGIALQQYEELRNALGYSTLEDHEAVKAAMKKDREDILRQVSDVAKGVADAVAQAQQGGEADPKFEELRSQAQGLVAAYAQEPSSYKDSLIRMTNLLGNLSALSTAFALNDVALRRSLTSADAINSERLAQETSGFEKSKQDLEATHVQHEKERSQLMAAVDEAQTRLRQLSTDLAQLQSRYDRDTERLNRDLQLARSISRQLQEEAAKTDVVLDRADGKVLGVDYSTNTVRLDLTRSMGARPQMKFSIFDSASPGLPTESPKARVELIRVTDRDSVARIETGSTFPLRPIRPGDQVYSAAWSPNDPQKFALIGPIDINRDGKDDRGDLIRMIEAAGGVVEFDLPPPDADVTPGRNAVTRAYLSRGEPAPSPQGRAIGELTSRFAYYVIDERGAFYKDRNVDDVPSAEEGAFTEAVSEATRVARENGIRPLPIDRLLAYMGYSSYTKIPVEGRTEYTNPAAIKALTQPKGNTAVGTGAGAAASPEAGSLTPDF